MNLEIQTSIESGYFIMTMMPSLYCDLRCPHCYLSLEQRRDETRLSVEKIKMACEKVDQYYEEEGLKSKKVILYWYGGEPTSMPMEYFEECITVINNTFTSEKGYTVKHIVLSSLVKTDAKWFEFIKRHCDGEIQTSYDGLMRGKGYLRDWELKVREAQFHGLEVTTISVMNSEIIKQGAKYTTDYLNSLNIKESGWLPFMLNEQNKGRKYDRYAPTMNNWSKFMVEMSELYAENIKAGRKTFEIGQLQFILTQGKRGDEFSNIAGQTMFLMPNGDFTLPDYRNGYEEYMRKFGNIVEQSFREVIHSEERINYLGKQMTKNFNSDCLNCNDSHRCVMEFWKENKEDDDCFGGKKYIEWIDNNIALFSHINGESTLA